MSCFVSAICLAGRSKNQDAGWALVYVLPTFYQPWGFDSHNQQP